MKGLLGLPGSRPLIKSVCRYEAPAILECFAEGRFVGYRLRARIDHLVANACFLRPVGDQTPANLGELTARSRGILAYDADVLGRSDVVARFPIDLVSCLEIFLDQLLALRQPIATAHTRSPWNDWSCAADCCTICSPSWARLLFCLSLESLYGDSPIKLDAKRSNAPRVVSIIIATGDTRALPIWNLKNELKTARETSSWCHPTAVSPAPENRLAWRPASETVTGSPLWPGAPQQ